VAIIQIKCFCQSEFDIWGKVS